MLTKQARDEIARVVKDDLDQRFGGLFVFGPITAEEQTNLYGDAYLHLEIVFDGDPKNLDSDWTVGMLGRIRPKIEHLGAERLESKAFRSRAEYEALLEKVGG